MEEASVRMRWKGMAGSGVSPAEDAGRKVGGGGGKGKAVVDWWYGLVFVM